MLSKTQPCLAENPGMQHVWRVLSELDYLYSGDSEIINSPDSVDMIETINNLLSLSSVERLKVETKLREIDLWLAKKDPATGKVRRELVGMKP